MKDKIKKLFASLAALVMAVGLMVGGSVPVMAEGNGSITITPPNGVTNDQDYKIYKVFQGVGNGSNISYKLLDGQTIDAGSAWATASMGTYFTVDSAGNVSANDAAIQKDSSNNPVLVNGKQQLTAAAITAIGNYVTAVYNLNAVSPATPSNPTYTATKQDDGKYKASNVDDGYYYITTTTGTVVTIDSANHTVDVTDKNSVPTVDKIISTAPYKNDNRDNVTGSLDPVNGNSKNAIAEVGSTVAFTSTITVGKGAKNYVYHDKMGSGLTLNTSNISVNYKVDNNQGTTAQGFTVDSDYTLNTSPGDGDTFDITFTATGLAKVNENSTITIQYYATVNSDALRDGDGNSQNANGQNTAKVSFGDKNDTTQESTTKVYNAKITVSKTFQGLEDDANLANNDSAQFVLYKTGSFDNGATKAYYKYDSANKNVTWVTDINDATHIEFKKNNDTSNNEFKGLADGTYTLTESKVPNGYNKAPDQEITIDQAQATNALTNINLEKTASFQNNTGSVLPSTGGIGTTIFYVAGGILIIGAAVLLIARRKRNA